MTTSYFPLAFLLSFTPCMAQTTPVIQWQKSFGGSNVDDAFAGLQTNDGGYVIAGESQSNNGNVTGNHGFNDFWVVKTDATGALQWQKSLGGSGYDYATAIEQTMDGGYILAGASTSTDGDVTGNHGQFDMWVVKLDSNGELQWQRSLGGSASDGAYAVQQDSAGNFWVAGYAGSTDGDVIGNHGDYRDLWLVKLNTSGVLLWEKCYGGSSNESAFGLDFTGDGGCVLTGYTASNDGDVTGNHGGEDYWVVKVDSVGSLQWQDALAGSGFEDIASSVQQTNDGGYIVAGQVESNDGDVTGFHGGVDGWVVKLDGTGTIQWETTLGGSDVDRISSIQQISDNEYIASGYTSSIDDDVLGNHGGADGWVVKLDSVGTLLWQKTLGGSGSDASYSVHRTNDGGFFLAGSSNSNDGDVSGNHGDVDIWTVKLGPDNVGIPEMQVPAHFSLYPNPSTSVVQIELDLKAAAPVHVQLFDATGKLMATVLDEKASAGAHRIRLSTEDLPTGLYELRLTAGGSTMTRRLVKE